MQTDPVVLEIMESRLETQLALFASMNDHGDLEARRNICETLVCIVFALTC